MKDLPRLATDVIVGGTIAGAATTLAAAAIGQARDRRPYGPINATSHIVWGERAARASRADLAHTAPGLALNLGAGMWWAAVYEACFGDAPRASVSLAGGVALSALAYVVDYHVVPRRLTPGWELRMSPRELALMYGVLALALPLRALLQHAAAAPRSAGATPAPASPAALATAAGAEVSPESQWAHRSGVARDR